jgi:hypothetical protein
MKTLIELYEAVKLDQVEFKVEKNKKNGDFRVVRYVDGKWDNEIDGNWNKKKATEKRDAIVKNNQIDF